jgi:hypothetical protein
MQYFYPLVNRDRVMTLDNLGLLRDCLGEPLIRCYRYLANIPNTVFRWYEEY